MFTFYRYPHTDLNQPNFEWIIQKIKELEEATGTGALRVMYASSESDLVNAAASSEGTIIIVNDGIDHAMTGQTIPTSNTILFTSGTFSGTGTINAHIIAQRQQIFASNANITIGELNNPVGFPEWYGAVPDSATADNTAALQKCFDNFRCTDLAEADYYLSGPVYLNRSNTEFRGQGESSYAGGTRNGGTRLISLNAAANILTVGDTTLAFNVTTIYVHDFSILPLIADYTATAGLGINVKCIRNLRVNNVTVINFFTGFRISSVMDAWVTHCRYICNKPDTSTAACVGFDIVQDLPYASANSSISSLWLRECEANFTNTNTAATAGYGVRSASGATGLADMYMDALNFVGVPNAIMLAGNSSNTIQQNIWIRDCTIDNCLSAIEITGALKTGIVNNWISCGAYASGSTHRGVYIHDNGNADTMLDGNIIKNSDTSTATAYGIRIAAAHAVHGDNEVINFPFPCLIGVGTAGAPVLKGFDMGIHAVNNKQQYNDATNNIFRLLDCSMSSFKASCSGDYGYNTGIYVHTSSSYCTCIPTGIDQIKTTTWVSDNGTAVSQPFTSFGTLNVMISPHYA